MSRSNENSEDESSQDDLSYPCGCDMDKERVKNLTNSINQNILNVLERNPSFSSFIETQIINFQREISFFIRRLFDAKRQNAIKVKKIELCLFHICTNLVLTPPPLPHLTWPLKQHLQSTIFRSFSHSLVHLFTHSLLQVLFYPLCLSVQMFRCQPYHNSIFFST